MKFYNLIIQYRFWLSVSVLVISVVLNLTGFAGFWPVFPLYFVGVIGLASHFFIGPLRLIQGPMESGDVKAVQKILDSVWYPNLLYAPVRSTYYSIKGNLAMMSNDFTNAEKFLKESASIGSPMPQAEGANKLQLGMMAMQKGDLKEAESYMRAAIRLGFADRESEAVANLSMCQIYINKKQFRPAKDYFKKAKECKPKTKQVVEQIVQIEKYISRMPG